MSFCVSCGSKIPEGGRFCPACGKPVGEIAGGMPAGANAGFAPGGPAAPVQPNNASYMGGPAAPNNASSWAVQQRLCRKLCFIRAYV